MGNGGIRTMRLCPRCKCSTKESERIEKDHKKNKHWLITYCGKCGFNFDLVVYAGSIQSPQEEMDKYVYPPPLPPPPNFWGYGY